MILIPLLDPLADIFLSALKPDTFKQIDLDLSDWAAHGTLPARVDTTETVPTIAHQAADFAHILRLREIKADLVRVWDSDL